MTEDRITIRDLRVSTKVGVTERERSRPQEVVIDLQLIVDLRAAGTSDDLDDTVDYDRLTSEVGDLVRASETNLLESLAERIARHVCTFPSVERVSVEVTKAAPPVQEEVGPIAVRITRP